MKKDNFDIFDYLWSKNKVKKEYIDIYKISWDKLMITYLIGGLAGTLWETFLVIFKKNYFEFRNGSFFLPFNPVYGFGLCAIIIFLHKLNTTKQIFVVGAVVGGVAEYSLSFLQEMILGSKSWDYSNRFLNINGRTTIPYCLFWGFGCVLIMRFVYPLVFKYIEKLAPRTIKVLGTIFLIIVVVDLFFTVGVLFRYNMRQSGNEAITFIGRFFDSYFPDSRVELFFPNMKLT